MNKILFRLMSLFLVATLLVGCGANNNDEQVTPTNNNNNNSSEVENNSSDEITESITVVISKDEEEEIITEKEIEIEENDILMDVMKENFDIEETDGFIDAIDGLAPEEGESKAWMYFVNGEMAMVGAAEYELSPGDEVSFDLQSWE